MTNKINELKVVDFMGLKGERLYTFDKITALCEKNGSGKTSILEALRWALTNELPEGEAINRNADKAYVEIVFENGESFAREISNKKTVSNKYFYNDKKVTLKEFNDAFENATGISADLAKVISSADIIEGLNNQEFGKLILSYLPEKLTLEYMLEKAKLNQITFNEKSIALMQDFFGFGEFELDDLNRYHEDLMTNRREAKKYLKKYETLYDEKKGVLDNMPTLEEEECKRDLENLQKKRDEAIRYEQDLKNYKNTLESQKKQEDQIKTLEENIKKGPNAINHSLDVFNNLDEQMNNYKQIEKNLYSNLTQSKNNIIMFKKALENINSSHCPLSKNIICTTDKTSAIEDIQKTLKDNLDLYKKNKEDYKRLGEHVKRVKESKEITLNEKKLYDDKQNLIKQLEQVKKFVENKVQFVEKNGIDTIENIDKKIEAINLNLNIYKEIKLVKELEQRINSGREYVSNLEILTFEFSPKGNLRHIIIQSYLENFSQLCNAKAKELFENLEIKFDANQGVELLADINGDGNFLNMKSLSGGERASVIFLIMDMLNSLSGFNIFILDELSVLDNNVFNNLIDVIKKYDKEYDMCIIASVDHEDIIKTLNEKKITITKIEDFKEIA